MDDCLLPALLLILPISLLLAESGSDDVDDEPDIPQLQCFVRFTDRRETERISCRLSEPLTQGDNITLTFSEAEVTERCFIQEPNRSCSVPVDNFSLFSHCCVRVIRAESIHPSPCVLNKKITHMVKTGSPFNVRVTSLMEAEEVKVTWDVPKIRLTRLLNGLVHQLSYGTADSAPQLLNVTVRSLRLQMKNLQANCKYTIQVRSAPDQDYFRGVWSDWSEPVTFTIPSIVRPISTGLMVTLCMLLLFVLFLVGLVVLLWENRIKPHIWPKIPNPKKALEQLYTNSSKLQVAEVSFDPDHFLEVTESRVDMTAVKGVWLWCYPDPPTQTAGDHSAHPERKLLMLSELVAEDGVASGLVQAQQCAEEPTDHSHPQPCLSPALQPQGGSGSPCHSPGPRTQDLSSAGAACVLDDEAAQRLEAAGVQGEALGCLCTPTLATPPDESYITMSNLYKTQ